jgi:hypothetical protein
VKSGRQIAQYLERQIQNLGRQQPQDLLDLALNNGNLAIERIVFPLYANTLHWLWTVSIMRVRNVN